MASVKVRHGSEGPEHDPYSFTEVTFYFTNPKKKPIKLHAGLAEWIEINGKKHTQNPYGKQSIYNQFKTLTGISFEKAEQIPNIIFNRYLKTLSKEEQWNVLECIEADRAMLRYAM